MKTDRHRKPRQAEAVPSIDAQLTIHEKTRGRKVPEINEQLLDLIHMMMRVRQLEFDLLGRYVYLQSYPEAEKRALVEALEQVVHAAGPTAPADGGPTIRRLSVDAEAAGNRCPVGFHEQDGRCVPD